MKLAIATTTGMLALALCAAPAATVGDPSPTRKCEERGSKTLLRSPRVRVYRERGTGDKVACLYSSGKRSWLEAREDGLYAYPPPAIAIAGLRVVSATDHEHRVDWPRSTLISVTDLRDGSNTGIGESAGAPERDAAVGSAVINNRGSMAWIACPGAGGQGDPRPDCVKAGSRLARVYKREVGGELVVLDEGSGVDPRSLRRREAKIWWTRDGVRRTATLK
jgi:hypothetical protein